MQLMMMILILHRLQNISCARFEYWNVYWLYFGDIQYIFAIHFSINVFSIYPYPVSNLSLRIQYSRNHSTFVSLSSFFFFFICILLFERYIFEFRRNREEYFTYRVKENRIIISKESTMKCTTIKIKINWKRIIFVKI